MTEWTKAQEADFQALVHRAAEQSRECYRRRPESTPEPLPKTELCLPAPRETRETVSKEEDSALRPGETLPPGIPGTKTTASPGPGRRPSMGQRNKNTQSGTTAPWRGTVQSPVEQNRPSQPMKPNQSPRPNRGVQSSQSTQVSQPSQSTQPTHTTQPSQPTQPTHTTQPSQPTQPTHATQPPQPTRLTHDTQPTPPTRVEHHVPATLPVALPLQKSSADGPGPSGRPIGKLFPKGSTIPGLGGLLEKLDNEGMMLAMLLWLLIEEKADNAVILAIAYILLV